MSQRTAPQMNKASAINVNETPVVISNGGGDTATVTIDENTTGVATVGASDPDAGTALSYAIVGGADQAKFQVSATTGALSFVTAPNFEANGSAAGNNSYVVQVRASAFDWYQVLE